MNRLLRCVSLATAEQSKSRGLGGGRVGTITGLTLQDFARRFGDPHEVSPNGLGVECDDFQDGKITASWHFVTPRGIVEVGDYWWNKKDELSVRAGNLKALRWFARWARDRGMAYTGWGPRWARPKKV